MGLMDIVKKAFLGASDEDNRKNKAKMREIFNSCVSNGEDYKIIYCHMENTTNAVVVKVTKHSNFIVGYKEGEVIVIPVDADLTEHGDAYIFNKENQSYLKSSLGFCRVGNAEQSFQFVPVTFEPGINRGASYSVAITQSSEEVSEFKKFFKKGFWAILNWRDKSRVLNTQFEKLSKAGKAIYIRLR